VLICTGYYYDELLEQTQNTDWQKLLQHTDILVDGPYMQEEATPMAPFLGSSNQRMRELKRH
jgi:anaerobic ribonucleoside-triphosphate reductase activating protein